MRGYIHRIPLHGHKQESIPLHVYEHNEFLDLTLYEYYVHIHHRGKNMKLLQMDLHLHQLIPSPSL